MESVNEDLRAAAAAATAALSENRALDLETAKVPADPSGQARFEEVEPGLTRVEVALSYTGSCDEGGEAAAGTPRSPQLMLDRDLRDLRDLRETLRERSAPEEAQGLPPIATARSELAVFIAGVVGSALLTGLVLVLAIRAYGKRRASANRAGSSTGCLASANRQERLRGHVNSSGR